MLSAAFFIYTDQQFKFLFISNKFTDRNELARKYCITIVHLPVTPSSESWEWNPAQFQDSCHLQQRRHKSKSQISMKLYAWTILTLVLFSSLISVISLGFTVTFLIHFEAWSFIILLFLESVSKRNRKK